MAPATLSGGASASRSDLRGIRQAQAQTSQSILKSRFLFDTQSATPADRTGNAPGISLSDWDLEGDRFEAWLGEDRNCKGLWDWLMDEKDSAKGFAESIGLVVDRQTAPPTVFRRGNGWIKIEVHSVMVDSANAFSESIQPDPTPSLNCSFWRHRIESGKAPSKASRKT